MLYFIKNRPPFTIFFLCIVSLALTLIYFAFYIKNTEEILDTDKINEWNELLEHFNKLEYCIRYQNPINNSFNYKDLHTVTTLVNFKGLMISKFSNLRGYLSLEGWNAKCSKNIPKPDYLEFKVVFPHMQHPFQTTDICVELKGPREYLPSFSEPNCMLEHNKHDPIGFLTTVSKSHLNETFCPKNHSAKLEFYPQIKNNFANFISDAEKGVIYVHLLWASCLLLLVIIFILIYGLLYTDKRLNGYLHKCSTLIQNT